MDVWTLVTTAWIVIYGLVAAIAFGEVLWHIVNGRDPSGWWGD